ncbi:MAG: acetyl-CoA carboxylase biotin carboxyl carrier protein [Coriobacteriaceae bacterium]|nr:acetyl-CoA carboxylase biotin carboxyl carrier protein [Coriobacteriaceae bacterium]MDD7110819.1 acetyl-CoA carboxylase biotin carboxyl carrier protein [Coriobacteriaceae bacterium]
MDLETLRGFADLMEERGLTRIKLEEPDLTLELEREGAGATQPPAWPAFPPAMPAAWPAAPAAAVAAPAAPATAEPAAPTEPAQIASGATEVCAPMVGVFYVAPSPGAEPFVHVGSKVKKGETLCILEAMKLMNEVVAECDGEIAEICANDGDLVEYGRVLFRIY